MTHYKWKLLIVSAVAGFGTFLLVWGGHHLHNNYIQIFFYCDPLPFAMLFSTTLWKSALDLQYRVDHVIALVVILGGNLVYISHHNHVASVDWLAVVAFGSALIAFHAVAFEVFAKSKDSIPFEYLFFLGLFLVDVFRVDWSIPVHQSSFWFSHFTTILGF